MYMKKLVGILLAVLAVGGTALAAGKVVENELDYEKGKPVKEVDDDVRRNQQVVNTETKQQGTDDIGKEKAKEIALQHAGVSADQVIWEEVERDYDDGRLEYQIEFRVGNKEYEYEVDAKTGNIFERDFDVDDERDDDRYDDDRWDD